MLKNDDVSCAVLYRSDKRSQWEILYRTLKKSVAFRSAFFTREQEKLTNKADRSQTIVVLAEDWDANKISPLTPPAGFEDDLIEEGKIVAAKHVASVQKAREDELAAAAAAPLIKPRVSVAVPKKVVDPSIAQVGEEIKPAEPETKDLIYTELEL